MPLDKKAVGDFIGTVRRDESAYKAAADRAARMRRVISAAGPGSGETERLASAIAGVRGIGEDPGANQFGGTRTADLFRGLLTEEEVSAALNGEGGPDVGLQKIAVMLYDRLGKLGVGEKMRGEFLGDVMNRLEARLAGKE